MVQSFSAEPSVRNLSVRGLQIGGTTTLVVGGGDLGAAPRLLFSFPASQTLKPGANDRQATFDVTLDDKVPAGYAHLRVVTDGGVSAPVVIALDSLAQRPLAATVESLPTALHGAVNGSSTAEAKFAGKAGQKVLVEVESQRLGNRLRPVVHLYSPKRLQVGWSWPSTALSGDTRLEATLPQDGTYTVAVHDTEYAGQAPGFFRLKIGQWAFVDQVFPPVVDKDHKAVELIGPAASLRVDLPAARTSDVLPLEWPKGLAWSGPRPFVRVSSRREIVGQSPSAKVEDLPDGPLGVSGRLLAPGQEDRYRIPVKPGTKVRFEVFAERLGSPLDVALVIRGDKDAVLARAEDSPGSLDPVLEYTAPDKVTSVVLGVADSQERGGPRGVYRLTVDPQTAPARADFRLFTPARGASLCAGGRSVVPVLVERRGYQGSVTVEAAGLPAGMKLEGAVIPAGADGTLVTIQRGEEAAAPAITTWRGRSEDGQERSVVLKGDPLERLQPWMASEFAVAPTSAKGGDFQVEWRDLAADAGLAPAGKLVLPVKLTRAEANSPVRLTLLTSQVPPLLNNQPDPNQTLRVERPVEVAAKVSDGAVTLLVPPQLTSATYDIAVQAELLTPDRARVLATAYTPVRRLPVRLPVVVQVDGEARREVTLDAKAPTVVEIKGKVERREGFAGDVVISLTGLPPGAQAPPVTVKAGAETFALKVTLPATFPAQEVKALRLAGTVVPDAKQANVRVRSRDVELTLVVKRPMP